MIATTDSVTHPISLISIPLLPKSKDLRYVGSRRWGKANPTLEPQVSIITLVEMNYQTPEKDTRVAGRKGGTEARSRKSTQQKRGWA